MMMMINIVEIMLGRKLVRGLPMVDIGIVNIMLHCDCFRAP